MILRVLTIAALLTVSFSVSAYAKEEKSFWRGVIEFFYPSLRTEEASPGDSLQAPFVPEGQSVKPVVEEGVIAYDKPHRLTSDVGKWLMSTVSEVLDFSSADYKTDLDEGAMYFDETGRAQYLQFLEDNKLIKILESNKYYIRNFVEDVPLKLNEGVVGDHYRWLFEVPVIVSYMERGMSDYAKGDATSQSIVLRVQVARSPQGGDMGVVIDQWSGRVGKMVGKEK